MRKKIYSANNLYSKYLITNRTLIIIVTINNIQLIFPEKTRFKHIHEIKKHNYL